MMTTDFNIFTDLSYKIVQSQILGSSFKFRQIILSKIL